MADATNQNNQSDNQDGELSPEGKFFDNLLVRLDSLETKISSRSADDLASEAHQQRQQRQESQDLDLEEMSKTELAQTILDLVNQEAVNPILVAVEQLKIQREIDSLVSKPENQDFFDYEQDVKKLMIDNPKLSVKQAYNLAKIENPKTQQATSPQEERQDLLKQAFNRQPVGEKPGVTSNMTTRVQPATVRDAAERAVNDLKIKFDAP